MLSFEVSLSGRQLCTAGAPDVSVLGVTVTAVKRRGSSDDHELDIDLRVGGLASDARLEWEVPRSLRIGDEIMIRVVDVERPDPPEQTKRDDQAFVDEQERKYYERLREKYGA